MHPDKTRGHKTLVIFKGPMRTRIGPLSFLIFKHYQQYKSPGHAMVAGAPKNCCERINLSGEQPVGRSINRGNKCLRDTRDI